ncbi:MAG: twitch domain-containing radical SAM protein [Bdellovibrio sp.]|nr:twitch domain-containing radical SAM protein [Bdellovibrio sp.]
MTMHLQNGQTHSCHHPMTHQVTLSELRENKTALHNTRLKKKIRKKMLQGEKPKECQYCWNMEKLGSHIVSDRHIKSNDEWALPSLEQVANLPWDSNINPTYVEVSFSNTCNFKCAYCFPHISSKWMSEIKEYGPYPTYHRHNSLKYLERSKLLPLPSEEGNPYVESFWQWWPELYPTLKVFRITGGEPLLSPNTFKSECISNNPTCCERGAFRSNQSNRRWRKIRTQPICVWPSSPKASRSSGIYIPIKVLNWYVRQLIRAATGNTSEKNSRARSAVSPTTSKKNSGWDFASRGISMISRLFIHTCLRP